MSITSSSSYLQVNDIVKMAKGDMLTVSMWVDEAESTPKALKVCAKPDRGGVLFYTYLPRSVMANVVVGQAKTGERAPITFDCPVWKVYASVMMGFVIGPAGSTERAAA